MSSTLERIALRYTGELSSNELVALYDSVGWTAYTAEPAKLAAAVANSSFVVTAWADDTLVGLARVVSDDLTIAFLHDLLVRPEFESQGVRARLLEAVLDRYRHVRQKVFLTDGDDQNGRLYSDMGLRNTKLLRRMSMDAWVRYEGFSLH